MAAYSAGATTVLIPADNQRDIEKLDPLARENLTLIPCRKITEVLELALTPAKKANVVSKPEAAASAPYIPTAHTPDHRVHFTEK